MAASASASAASAPAISIPELQGKVAAQGALIRQLKADGKGKEEVLPQVQALKALKEQLKEALEAAGGEARWDVDKDALDNTLTRRMFVVPSFEIYNGVAGLFDFGPPGTAFKENLLAFWRRHFVFEEGMLQLECTTLTPEAVLKTSGHVDKFTDLMVKDPSNGECFRADKLLEDHIDELLRTDVSLTAERRQELTRIRAMADAFTPEELGGHITALGIVSPSSGTPFTDPFPFNLMFATSIGPAGDSRGFLRPETAQGMFMNFRRLLDYNGGRVPFAATQVGTAYRNEIAPRNGLLRVREFTMAEIEHFVDPEDKAHAKFAEVAGDALTLFTARHQTTDGETIRMTAGEAVKGGVVDNETLAYFMARTQRFLLASGISAKGLRFRQHLRTEMAHYATDCWDAEILMAAGWVECVGHADRSCYDLEVHADATRTVLEAAKRLPEPVMVEVLRCVPNKGALGRRLKKAAKPLIAHLAELDADGCRALSAALDASGSAPVTVDGVDYEVAADDVAFKEETRRVVERKFRPSVIEPSFGIGRIMQGVFEHTYHKRPEDASRTVFRFPPVVAPFKAAVVTVDGRIPPTHTAAMRAELTSAGLSVVVDESGVAIGRKYARVDEIGVPFAVTIDGDTERLGSATVRERDSMEQVRVPLAAIPAVLAAVCRGEGGWEMVQAAAGAAPADSASAPAAAAAAAPLPPSTAAAASAPASAPAPVGPEAFSRSASLPTAVSGTAVGSVGLVLADVDKPAGRFARPAKPIL